FSLADAARFLNSRLGTNGQVLFEGPPDIASSLGFYLERKFAMVNQWPDPRIPLSLEQRRLFLEENAALEQWRAPRPVLLTIAAKRNVLKRFERVDLLKKRGQWKETSKVIGLPKTKPDV